MKLFKKLFFSAKKSTNTRQLIGKYVKKIHWTDVNRHEEMSVYFYINDNDIRTTKVATSGQYLKIYPHVVQVDNIILEWVDGGILPESTEILSDIWKLKK